MIRLEEMGEREFSIKNFFIFFGSSFICFFYFLFSEIRKRRRHGIKGLKKMKHEILPLILDATQKIIKVCGRGY